MNALNSTTSFLGKSFNVTGTASLVYGVSVYVGDTLGSMFGGTMIGIVCFILMYRSAKKIESEVVNISQKLSSIGEIEFSRYFDYPEEARQCIEAGLNRIMPIADQAKIEWTECPYENQLTEIFEQYSGNETEKRFLYTLTIGLLQNGGGENPCIIHRPISVKEPNQPHVEVDLGLLGTVTC